MKPRKRFRRSAPRATLHRDPSSRLKAIAFGLAAAMGAAAALADAAVNALHSRAPELALAIDKEDPVALVRNAEQAGIARGGSTNGEAAKQSVVQRSIAHLPINGPALRLSGLSGAQTADPTEVRAQMQLSDAMERRDIGAQLWLIESAVETNDVARALKHYDRALRIEEASRPLLYPVLTKAMDSAVIRERFVPYLAANPPWLESFLRFAVSNTARPRSLAQLSRENGGWPQGAAFSSLDSELLARLVDNDNYAEAADHFRRMPDADTRVLSDLQLTDASTNWRHAPITWQPFRLNGIQPYILASAQGNGSVEIEAEMEAGFKGPVARKFLALKAGAYQLAATMRAEDHSRQDLVRWSVSCAGGPQAEPIMLEEFALNETIAISGEILVPEDCPVQKVLVAAETLVTTRFVKLVFASAKLNPMSDTLPLANAP